MGSLGLACKHGGSFYSPLSPNRNVPLSVYASQPFARDAWITSVEPTPGGHFLFGSAAGSTGVLALAGEQHVQPLNAIMGRVWDLSVSKGGRLLATRDRNRIFSAQIHDGEGQLEVTGRFEFGVPRTADGSRLEQVRFMTGSDERYALRDTSSVQLWSLGTKKSAFASNVMGLEAGRTVHIEWCPHTPDMLAVLSEPEGASLHDIRSPGSAVFRQQSIPISAPSKARWNPFIPYWLAISTEDGIATFDLRYATARPAAFMSTPRPNDFAWSNANGELLLSVSSNRSASLWSLRGASERIAFLPHSDCGGDIVRVFPSPRELNVYYGLTLLGRIVRIDVQESFLRDIAPHVHESGIAREIETALYCRDFGAVHHALLEYSNSAAQPNFSELQFMTNQTMPSLPITPDSWKVGSLNYDDGDGAKFAQFQQDVDKYSRVCPPGFAAADFESENSRIKDAVEYVRLKVRVLGLIQQGDSKGLAAIKDRILAAMDRSSNFLNAQVLIKVVAVLMTESRLEALKFGRFIVAKAGSLDSETCEFVRLLLSPTVFDEEATGCVVVPRSNQSSPTRSVKTRPFARDDSPTLPAHENLVSSKLPTCKDSMASLTSSARDNSKSPKLPTCKDSAVSLASPARDNSVRSNLPTCKDPTASLTSPVCGDSVKSKVPTCKDPAASLAPPVPAIQPNRQTQGAAELARVVRTVGNAIAMIDLEVAAEEAGDEDRVGMIVDALTSAGQTTISARLIWICLEALLARSQMDAYFLQVGKYISQPVTVFGSALLEHMERQVLPKLKYVLAQAIDTQRPSLVVRAVMLIAIVADGVRPLPEGLEPFLIDRLRRLVRAMASEDYSNMQGYAQLVACVQSLVVPTEDGIWREISRLQSRIRHI